MVIYLKDNACDHNDIIFYDDMKGMCQQCMYKHMRDKYNITIWTIGGKKYNVEELLDEEISNSGS